jgi:hypothetical protein
MGHERNERRGLALHRAIAAKLRDNPDLLEIAKDNLRRWSTPDDRSQAYLDQWRDLLNLPLADLLVLLNEDSPRMTELRQSSPFAGILEPRERWHIYDTFESGAHHSRSGDNR